MRSAIMHISVFLHAALLLLPAGCSRPAAGTATSCSPEIQASADSFPLPQIPLALTLPGERAAYAAIHFWESAILPDSATAGLGQAMADFASLAAMTADTAVLESAAAAMMRVPESHAQLDALLEVAEHYLFNPDSPLRNEEMFIALLRAAPSDPRRAGLLECLLKNRPGTKAASFTIRVADGRRTTLAAEALRGPLTLVYFFDTECNTCRSLIPAVEKHAARIGARVVAVAPEINAGSLDDAATLFPTSWTVGADTGEIDGLDLYFLPALPSIYLVDSTLTVLAKDLSL